LEDRIEDRYLGAMDPRNTGVHLPSRRCRVERGGRRQRAGLLLLVLSAACGPGAPVELPQPLAGPSPVVYPVGLWDLGMEGETIVMLHVTEAGTVDSVYVREPSGFAEFDSAATQGARLMRFTPGREGNRRKAMWTRLPVRFRHEAAEPGAARPPEGRLP
jgi:TonB family protein